MNTPHKNRGDQKGKHINTNEITEALKDEKRLKKNRKRLSLDWFFRPK